MIEAYIALVLLGAGYVYNQKKNRGTPPSNAVPLGEKPSMQNIYESKYLDTQKNVLFDAVKKAKVQEIRSELTGATLDAKNFHNNMLPFLRGSVTQNTDPVANRRIMENFGSNGSLRKKQEVSGMFVPEANTNVFDHAKLDSVKDRVAGQGSRLQNNVLPFDQVKVGRGVGQGFSAKPTGGFQQFNMQDYAMPKNVDELRPANKPKLTFEGRTVDGQKGSMRGSVGQVSNNRVPTAFEMGPERYMKTTGAIKRPAQNPLPEAKNTTRQATTMEYKGAAFAYGAQKAEQRPTVKSSTRPELAAFDHLKGAAKAANNRATDYGKSSVQVYGNERDVTAVRTHATNITSMVKSIMAPLQDIIKIARKEFLVEAPRQNGILQAQIPTKITVRDTNDVARTTIKETNIHDSERLNLKGISRITVYDPNDIMRTTMKDTLIHDAVNTNLRSQETKGQVYMSEAAKQTIRQTTDTVETNINIAQISKKGTVYDVDGVLPRTTIGETTLSEAPLGLVGNNTGVGAYQDTRNTLDAKVTQKETFVDNEYFGTAQLGSGEAYQNANFEAKETMKQDHVEYYGGIGKGAKAEATMSYDDAYNATMNGIRESALVIEHEPTQTGVKVSTGTESLNVEFHKPMVDQVDLFELDMAPQRNVTVAPSSDESFTKMKQSLRQDDRLDLEILEPFKHNPFTQSLSSY